MEVSLLVLLVVSISNIGLGLIVLLRNSRSSLGRSFFAITLALTAWAITNYLTEAAPDIAQNTFFNRLAYVTGLLSAAAMTLFSYFLSKKKLPTRRGLVVWSTAILLVGIFSYTDAIAGKVVKTNDTLTFYVGEYIIIWVVFVLVLLATVLLNFIHIYKQGNRRERNQARAIGLGFSITIVLGSFLNVVLPAFTARTDGMADFDTAKFGPLLTISLVFTTAYAIVRHGLFDIRMAITKTISYAITLFLLLAAYCIALVYVFIPLHAETPTTSQIVYIIIFSVVSSITFYPLKKFFDKHTKKLFYRDSFELDHEIESLSESLVGITDVSEALTVGLRSITKTVGTDYSSCLITRKGRRYKWLEVDNGARLINSQDVLGLHKRLKNGLTVTDWELNTKNHGKLHANRVGAVFKAQIKGEYELNLVLGEKKNGRIYNRTDIIFMEVACRNICLALENAIQYAQIKEFAHTLKKKVDTATSNLKLSNRGLARLNDLQTDFISATSHQLKPQLTSALGFSGLLHESLEHANAPKQQLESIKKIEKSLTRMVRIVETILEPSLIDGEVVRLNVSQFDLGKLLKSEIRELTNLANKSNIKLLYSSWGAVTPTYHGDANKLAEALFNLIENAVYYSEGGLTSPSS